MERDQGIGVFDGDPRVQRDRFVAFSFASTDLVFEFDSESRISFASGAAKELTGLDAQDLIGKSWVELIDRSDQAKLLRIVRGLQEASRSGPVIARLAGPSERPISVIFSACRLPHREGYAYCTLSAANMALALHSPSEQRDEQTGLLDTKGFADMAQATIEASTTLGESVELTFIELGSEINAGGGLADERQHELMSRLSTMLRAQSYGGDLAGKLADGRFGVLHEETIDGSEIENEVLELCQSFAPEGTAIEVKSGTLELDPTELSQEEAAQALVYTINQFATAEDGAVTIASLKAGFKGLAKQTSSKINRLKRVISDQRFDFVLQPVVSLADSAVQHFELLLRFEKNQSPYQWVVFAESIGLIQDLDMAVCRRAIDFLRHGTNNKNVSVAVNLSGRSLSSPAFVDDFTRFLVEHRALAHRLLIEVTESSEIHDLEQVNRVLQAWRRNGNAVGLDDFGSGAASFRYLQALDVEFVKFDGSFVRRMLESERDRLMLKAMAGLCRDLDIKTIGEMIEHEDQAAELRSLGVGLGQGYLFGKPAEPTAYGIHPPRKEATTMKSAGSAKSRFNPFTGAEVGSH